jgi:hypothetical protein
VSDVGETDTINRTLYYSDKFQADPDTAGDWTEYTTQPADNATFATAKAALLAGLNETDATAETRGTLPLSLKMVRTTTAAATDLLLDSFPNAAVAFSIRKLDKDYTGYAIRVREDSGDTEADIGFDGSGDLDTAAIATHCGSANGYVVTWYDQRGNSNNATQSTAASQPQIYNGTAVITGNGKPALDFDVSSLESGALTTTSQPITVVSVTTPQASSFSGGIVNTTDTNNFIDFYRTDNSFAINAGTTLNAGTYTVDNQYLKFSVFNGSSSEFFVNTSSITTGNAGTTGLSGNLRVGLFVTSSNNYMNGLIQEVVLWPSNQTSPTNNRTGIESDIDTYFSIT